MTRPLLFASHPVCDSMPAIYLNPASQSASQAGQLASHTSHECRPRPLINGPGGHRRSSWSPCEIARPPQSPETEQIRTRQIITQLYPSSTPSYRETCFQQFLAKCPCIRRWFLCETVCMQDVQVNDLNFAHIGGRAERAG